MISRYESPLTAKYMVIIVYLAKITKTLKPKQVKSECIFYRIFGLIAAFPYFKCLGERYLCFRL